MIKCDPYWYDVLVRTRKQNASDCHLIALLHLPRLLLNTIMSKKREAMECSCSFWRFTKCILKTCLCWFQCTTFFFLSTLQCIVVVVGVANSLILIVASEMQRPISNPLMVIFTHINKCTNSQFTHVYIQYDHTTWLALSHTCTVSIASLFLWLRPRIQAILLKCIASWWCCCFMSYGPIRSNFTGQVKFLFVLSFTVLLKAHTRLLIYIHTYNISHIHLLFISPADLIFSFYKYCMLFPVYFCCQVLFAIYPIRALRVIFNNQTNHFPIEFFRSSSSSPPPALPASKQQ